MRGNLRTLQIKITTRQKSKLGYKFLHSSLKLDFHLYMMKFVQVCGTLADRLVKEADLFRCSCLFHLIFTNCIQKLVALSLFLKIYPAEIGFLGKHIFAFLGQDYTD